MMIEIAVETNGACRFYTLTSEKAVMSVGVCRNFTTVCVHNAAAKLRRNLGGKVFHGPDALDLASKAYRSSEAKAMIHAVQQAERAMSTASLSAVAN
jgi:hypothetical protein